MQPQRQYSLDVLKIVGTILIVFHHYQQTTETFFVNGLNFFGGRFYFGYIVELFFLLSGFFIFRYEKKIKNGLTFPKFYFRRACRLLPLVAISGIAYEVLVFFYQKLYHQTWCGVSLTVWGTIIDALGIQLGWALPNPYVNNPTWYISILMLCYVIFYFLNYICRRLEIPSCYLYIFMIFLGMGICTYGYNMPFLNWEAARGYYSFFFGILLAKYLEGHPITKKGYLLCSLTLIGLLYLMIFHYGLVENGNNYLLTFFFYPSLIILALSPAAKKIFCHSCLGTLGNISFNVYLWHNPLFILMYIILKLSVTVNLQTCKAMICYTIICFAAGTASYYLLEKPINSRITQNPSCYPAQNTVKD